VAEKEQREQREASQSQRFIGEAMGEKLAQFTAQVYDSDWARRQIGNDCPNAATQAARLP